MLTRYIPVLSLVPLLLVACGDDETMSQGGGGAGGAQTSSQSSSAMGGGATTGTGGGGGGSGIYGGDRPVELKVPSSYSGAATPLVILLHGYGASGSLQNGYFGMEAAAEAKGMLYAYPDGLKDPTNRGYWNAFPACCDFEPSNVDDVGYLKQLIDDISVDYNVDAKRIFFVGHSNGGFMSYRMACEHSDIVAGIASLAGAMDPALCSPTEPVHALQIHGTDDETIAYGGDMINGNTFSGAVETVQYWSGIANCGTTPVDGMTLDIEGSIAGAETTVSRYEQCDAGGSAELWTIPAGTHIPSLSSDFATLVLDHLLAHPKP